MTKPPHSRNDLVLRREVAAIHRLKKRAALHGKAYLADIIEIGGRLERLKARVPHGDWLPLLRKEFDWSVATADNWIAVKRLSRSSEFKRLRNLPHEILYLLGRRNVSDELRAAVAARVKTGGKITLSEVKNTVRIGPRNTPPEPQSNRLSIVSAEHDAPTPPLNPLTAEDLHAASRRNLIDLIVDVASRLPHDQSFEEASAVVESVGDAEGMRERFSEAVAKLYGFVGQLQRALNEGQIDEVPARPSLHIISNKDN